MSGGSLQKNSFNLLSRERELQELRSKLKKADAALEEKKQLLRKGEQDVLRCDIQVDSFRDASHACEIDAAKQTEQLEIIRRDVENSEQAEQALADERAQLTENLSEVERERANADEQQTGIEQGNAATREDVSRAQGELAEVRKLRETAAEELTEQKVRRMALSKERDAVYTEQKRLVAEHRELTLRLTALEQEAEETVRTLDAIEQELCGMRAQI